MKKVIQRHGVIGLLGHWNHKSIGLAPRPLLLCCTPSVLGCTHDQIGLLPPRFLLAISPAHIHHAACCNFNATNGSLDPISVCICLSNLSGHVQHPDTSCTSATTLSPEASG